VLTGGCHCGALRYEARGEPYALSLCHCADCRRVSGAPALAWFSVKKNNFAFVSGHPAVYRSSRDARREFCGRCGAQITYAHEQRADEIDITTASLDDPNAAAPLEHIWVGSRLAWMSGLDTLPDRAMSGSANA